MTFLPFAVTLAVVSTMNDTSPFDVVTVRVLLAASNLLTVPEAVITVAFGALLVLATAALAGAFVGAAGAACAANTGTARASTPAAVVRLRNTFIRILLNLSAFALRASARQVPPSPFGAASAGKHGALACIPSCVPQRRSMRYDG